ncbi:Variable major outer membrane lipoprotein (plasmid) [Borrelia crocidurae DOU]|uniref:Variable large protein n=1 Tax=Borrelia crocidurae DOU TaxID=1293575 RepID=W5SL50_9SPIR|nr:Variable major outer membrane lipoprotein [Borrelia crocidurae DOU]
MKMATDVGGKALEVGVTTLTVNGVDNKDGAKILATSGGSNPGSDDSGKAVVILASVTGKEMLDSIVKSEESDQALSNNADVNTSALQFAKGGLRQIT